MNLRAGLKDEFQEYLMHELNTPLTVIKGYIEILRDSSDDPELTRYLTKIWENAERLEKIPHNMVEMFKEPRKPYLAD
jgi:two-component system phosphate regulon sensor histidine kinase PhoR